MMLISGVTVVFWHWQPSCESAHTPLPQSTCVAEQLGMRAHRELFVVQIFGFEGQRMGSAPGAAELLSIGHGHWLRLA